MSLWWFLPPLVLLLGALIAARQARGIRRGTDALRAQGRRVADLQPALVRIHRHTEELRAAKLHQHRQ